MATQRIEFVDLAKGICISLVVLLHVFGDLSGGIIQLMNLFRMPLYFVLSGLFFKTYDGFLPFVKKKTNKLLVPFSFTFVLVVLPIAILLKKSAGRTIVLSNLLFDVDGKLNLGIDGAIWFLLCLFAVNVYFYLIFLLSRRNIIGIAFLSIVCGLAGYSLCYYGMYLPMWMDSALTAMPFFLFGYLLRCYSDVLYGKFTKRDAVFALFSLIVLVSCYLYEKRFGRGIIVYGDNSFNISILSLYMGGIFGTYFILMISKYLVHIPILSYIGRYSIVVLLTHLLYLFAIRNILYQLNISQEGRVFNFIVFTLIMFISVPTITFCIKYLPHWFAQKDLLK